MAIPQEVEWNIIKFMSHPCADMIKEAVEEADTYDDHFAHTFSAAYFQHLLKQINTEDPNTWTDDYIKERYDNMINECYPLVEIGVLRRLPAEVLEVMDSLAYHIGMEDYWEAEKENYAWDF